MPLDAEKIISGIRSSQQYRYRPSEYLKEKGIPLKDWLSVIKLNPDKYLDDERVKNNVARMIKIFSNVAPRRLRFLPSIDLSNCDLSGTRLSGANLEGANLESAAINDSILNRVNFTNATLSYADLSYSKAKSPIFEKAILEGSMLRNTDFSDANFNSSRLTGSNLCKSKFANANLNNIDIYEDIFEPVNIGPHEFGFGPRIPLLLC